MIVLLPNRMPELPTPITRLDSSLPLPEYHTPGAVAFDFYARVETTIQPGEFAKIPSNLIIATPADHALLIFSRSSLLEKKRLILGNSVGIIDADYAGPKDEIHILVYNISKSPTTIIRGERFAQGLFVVTKKAKWNETTPRLESRGGFGSTG